MYPIKTYLDMADDTYMRGENIETRRDWARLEVRDSNTVGKDYLRLTVSHNAAKHPKWGRQGDTLRVGIRLHKGQVKMLIKALQTFLNEVEVGKEPKK